MRIQNGLAWHETLIIILGKWALDGMLLFAYGVGGLLANVAVTFHKH